MVDALGQRLDGGLHSSELVAEHRVLRTRLRRFGQLVSHEVATSRAGDDVPLVTQDAQGTLRGPFGDLEAR